MLTIDTLIAVAQFDCIFCLEASQTARGLLFTLESEEVGGRGGIEGVRKIEAERGGEYGLRIILGLHLRFVETNVILFCS